MTASEMMAMSKMMIVGNDILSLGIGMRESEWGVTHKMINLYEYVVLKKTGKSGDEGDVDGHGRVDWMIE
jgi:hypothetical protein